MKQAELPFSAPHGQAKAHGIDFESAYKVLIKAYIRIELERQHIQAQSKALESEGSEQDEINKRSQE